MDLFEAFVTITAIDQFSNTFGLVKTGLMALGAGALNFAKESIETGKQFESGMSQIQATLGITADEIANNTNGAADSMAMLEAKAKEMGASTKFSATEAAEGLNILSMSGYSAEESCGMVEDVLYLAAAGSLDLATAAQYTSGALKGFADDTKDAQYYTDLMAKGATLANTDVNALGEALSGGAATAASYGQDAEMLTVALLRMGEQGVEGTAASTALNRAMADLYTPTEQAAKAMEELGVSAYTESGQAKDLNDVVDELNASMEGMTEEQKNAYKASIFTSQGLNAFNKMTVTSTEKVEEFREGVHNATGSAAEQYAAMTDNLEGDIDIMNSSMDSVKIAIYDSLNAPLRDVTQNASGWLTELGEAFTNDGLTGGVEALGGILAQVVQYFVDMAPQMVEMGLQLITSFINGIISALPQIAQSAIQIITSVTESLISMLPTILDAGIQLLMSLIDGITEALPELIAAATDILVELCLKLTDPDALSGMIDSALALIMALADGLIEAIPEIIAAIPTIITNLLNAILTNIPKIIETGWELLIKLAIGIIKAIPSIVKAIPELIAGLVSSILNGRASMFDAATKLADKIKEVLTGLPAKAIEWGKDMIRGLADGIKNAIHMVTDAVSNVANSIKNFLHFSRPDKGPLRYYEEWMPDMIQGMVRGIRDNKHLLTDEIEDMATDMDTDFTVGFDSVNQKKKTSGVQVVQYINSQKATAAQLMQEAHENARRAVLLGV